ncbi:hypothetical protein SDC9_198899 [bioreactor metagenome]|uniref:Uncharacterized protein n=1 Tax=bioreactor metagenome TaxID=1076179 RepID=A0A645IJU0_9ZZZZ
MLAQQGIAVELAFGGVHHESVAPNEGCGGRCKTGIQRWHGHRFFDGACVLQQLQGHALQILGVIRIHDQPLLRQAQVVGRTTLQRGDLCARLALLCRAVAAYQGADLAAQTRLHRQLLDVPVGLLRARGARCGQDQGHAGVLG